MLKDIYIYIYIYIYIKTIKIIKLKDVIKQGNLGGTDTFSSDKNKLLVYSSVVSRCSFHEISMKLSLDLFKILPRLFEWLNIVKFVLNTLRDWNTKKMTANGIVHRS
jgi:hypothetical protein